MNLDKKRALASRIFKVGKERIIFVEPRLDEIKEAISKEDIRHLKNEGAIIIRDKVGHKKVEIKKKKKTPGNIKKNAKNSKREYMFLTRKLRKHVADLKEKKELTREQVIDLRKKIRSRYFKNKSQLKEHIKIKK